MNRLDSLSERALEIAGQAGGRLRDFGPKASTLLSTGMKLGTARAAARGGMAVVRRNPVIAVATIAGAGLLWYAARRRAKRAENGNGKTIDGSARRIDASDASDTGEQSGRTTRAKRSGNTTRRASGSRSRSASRESRTQH